MSDPIDRPFLQPLEPTAQQEGLDAPGFYSGTSDFINGGVYNGTFRIGPPQAASNLDVSSSLAGSNFAPGWRFVQSSNTAITAAQVQNSAAPAGSNLRFTFAAGAADDEAYIEQLVDITGTAVSNFEAYRLTVQASANDLEADIAVQYLRADGVLTGGSQTTGALPLVANTTKSIVLNSGGATDSKYARLRVVVRRGAATTTGTKTIDVLEVRRDRPGSQLGLSDINDPAANSPGRAYQYDGRLMLQGSSGSVVTGGLSLPAGNSHPTPAIGDFQTTSGVAVGLHGWYSNSLVDKFTFTQSTGGSNLLLGWSLMTITASNNNTPAASTEALFIPNPASNANSIRLPFPAHVVGVSARKAGATHTNGTAELEITKNGNLLINDIYTFQTTNDASFATAYTLGQYEFSAQDVFQIRVNTSITWAPTTLDLTAVVYLMVPLGSFL
jgi:hypothetical protein